MPPSASYRSKIDQLKFSQLPPAIAAKLLASVRRIRRIVFTRGILATLATLVIALLAIMGVDAVVTIYSAAVRWGLTAAAFAVTAFVAYRTLVRPLAKPFTPARIAALIEQRHPELEERLSTVVELLAMPETRERGSEQLVQVLTETAEADARDVSPDQEFTTRTVKPKLIVAAVAVGILSSMLLAWPRHTGRLLARAVAPYAEIDNVYADSIVVTPGDTVVLAGDPVEIGLDVLSGFPGQAFVRRETTDGARRHEVSERMRQVSVMEDAAVEVPAAAAEDGEGRSEAQSVAAHDGEGEGKNVTRRYRLLFPAVDKSFRYRVSCGHALSRYYTVTALIPPDVVKSTVTYQYPEYTLTEDATVENASEIAAVAGTRVRLAAELSRADLASTLVVGDREYSATNENGVVTWEFPIERDMSTRWHIALRDAHGYTNAVVPRVVRAIPDRVPTITVVKPAKNRMKLPPHSKLRFEYEATDDFGVLPAEAMMARDAGEWESVRIGDEPVNTTEGVWQGVVAVDLATLRLAGVSRLRFQLQVRDNLPESLGGPQVAQSSVFYVDLDQDSLSMDMQSLEEQTDIIEKDLSEIVERLKDAEAAVEEIREKLEAGEKLTEDEQRKLDDVRQDTATAEELAKKLKEEMENTPFDPLKEKLDKLTEENLTPAREQAEELQLANPEEQLAKAEKLEETLEDAVKAAEQALKDAQEFDEQLKDLAALQELADQQETLAEQAGDEMTAEEWEQWAKEQEELMAELKEQIAEDPAAMLEEMNQRKQEMDNLAQEARDLAQKQENLKENAPNMDAAEAAKQEQQLAQKADDLQQRMEDLSNDLQEFGESTKPMTEPMDNAAEQMDQAEQKANEAAQDMPNTAEQQQQAQEAMEEAANSMEKAKEQMGEMMKQLEQAAAEQAEQDRQNAEAMNEALDAMEAAADAAQQEPQQGDQPPPDGQQPGQQKQQAKDQAQKAADQLKQMAQQKAEQMGLKPDQMPSQQNMPSKEGNKGKPPRPQAHERAQVVPMQLRNVISERDWFKLSGDVKSGSMDAALQQVPAEYRPLVRQYFRELSSQK